jgi:hypothetical protein
MIKVDLQNKESSVLLRYYSKCSNSYSLSVIAKRVLATVYCGITN